jgi:hypothetical protein
MAKVYRQQQELADLQRVIESFVPDIVLPAVADDIKRLAPVDTGQLRDSVVPTPEGIEVRAPYAALVEFGTRHMEAQPYIRPAVYRYRSPGELQ